MRKIIKTPLTTLVGGKNRTKKPLNPPYQGEIEQTPPLIRGGWEGFVSAFTLVELLVSISLAIVLMTSISLFVTDWVKNITLQKNIVDNNWDFNDFKSVFSDNLNSLNKYATWFTNSTWALFKANRNYSKWGFTYIWEQNFTWTYCSWTDNDSTKHLIIKNFVPFESTNSDTFSWWYNYDDWTYKTSFFSWTIKNNWNSFSWTYFWPTDITFDSWTWMYVSDTLNNTILKFDKNSTNTLPQILVWKAWIFDENYASGQLGTWITLNNPTWLVYWNNTLFISDTLNNRILYLSGASIYTLLDENDSIKEPTWLAYNAWTLYISNSWRWEILSYSWWIDSNIFTKQNNSLKLLNYTFLYPTWINFIWWNLKISDFLDRKIKTINAITWNFASDSDLSPFDFSKLAYNKYSDYLLKTPIKSLNLDYSNNIFNFDMKYYKNYSCNDIKSNIERTYLLKKYLN